VYVSELKAGFMGMVFGGKIAEVMADAGNDISAVIAAALVQEQGRDQR
jgi:hypothetical protein